MLSTSKLRWGEMWPNAESVTFGSHLARFRIAQDAPKLVVVKKILENLDKAVYTLILTYKKRFGNKCQSIEWLGRASI